MFEAKINDHHIAASTRCRISLLSRDLLYLILWQYQCFELVKGMFVGGIHNTGFHGTDFPDFFGQRPGVNAADTGNMFALEKFIQRHLTTPITGDSRNVPDHNPLCSRINAFVIITVNTDIADERLGECNDLAIVTLIRNGFLVAAHAGVKNNFTSRDRFRTKADARKNTAVFQN